MKRALLLLAATALLAACGDDPTAPNAGRQATAAQTNVADDDGVILCDPEADPTCVPPPPPVLHIPLKACLNMASSGAKDAVILKQCGPAFLPPTATATKN